MHSFRIGITPDVLTSNGQPNFGERALTLFDNPILKLDDVVVTPHGICVTDECMRALAESAFRAALDMAVGREPSHLVNRDALAARR